MSAGGLNEGRLGALKDLGDFGMAHGTTALSRLLGAEISFGRARVIRKGTGSFPAAPLASGMILIAMALGGEGKGTVFIVLSAASTRHLLAHLCPSAEEDVLRSEHGVSAIKEAANIAICAYLNALGETTGMTLLAAPPELALQPKSLACLLYGTEVVSLHSSFYTTGSGCGAVRGDLYFLPDKPFLEKLLLTSTPQV